MFWDHLKRGHKNAVEHMKELPQRSLPTSVESRWFQVYAIPKDKHGENCEWHECSTVVYEVQDYDGLSISRHGRIDMAIQKAEDLNWELMNGKLDLNPKAKQPKGLSGYQESPVLDSTVTSNG